MTRSNTPIREYPLLNNIDPQISASVSFTKWEAAVAAGATLDELKKLHAGVYPNAFIAKLIAWHNMHELVEANADDAVARDMKRNR